MGCTEAPTVPGFQAWKAKLRHRCRKIVAARFGKLEKRGSHNGVARCRPCGYRCPLAQCRRACAGRAPAPEHITYDLRRLRLHAVTERIPKTHRYRITAKGLRTAIFYTRLYSCSLRTGLAIISPAATNAERP
jgi:hypothetical protein